MIDNKQTETTTSTLLKQLQDMVHSLPEQADEQSLQQQKDILNQLFRSSISEADTHTGLPQNSSHPHYAEQLPPPS
jgi:hypothetical protein